MSGQRYQRYPGGTPRFVRKSGAVVPSYMVLDGKLMKTLERETGIGPATNSLEGCDSTIELLPLVRLYQL
jgi:hypothetical protein